MSFTSKIVHPKECPPRRSFTSIIHSRNCSQQRSLTPKIVLPKTNCPENQVTTQIVYRKDRLRKDHPPQRSSSQRSFTPRIINLFRGPLSTRDRSLSSFYPQGIPFPVVLFSFRSPSVPFILRTDCFRPFRTVRLDCPPPFHTHRTVLYEPPTPLPPPDR